MSIKRSAFNKMWDGIFVIVVFLAMLAAVLPFINIIAVSLSDPQHIISGKVALLPKGLNFEAYLAVFGDQSMRNSLAFTVFLTIVSTTLSMVATVCLAYPLTQKRLCGQKFFTLIVIFTMYFSGGLIPDYLLLKTLRLTNTMWSLVLSGLISAYNLIILRTFMAGIPESLGESATLDGASDIVILTRIVIPLSGPVLATLCLFYAVSRWNTFQDALYYITNPKLYPLQLKLNMLLDITQTNELAQFEGARLDKLFPENIKSASIIFASIPIILVYPWLQKYFVKGVTLGAVKG